MSTPLLYSDETDTDRLAETLIALGESIRDEETLVEVVGATQHVETHGPVAVTLELTYLVEQGRTDLVYPLQFDTEDTTADATRRGTDETFTVGADGDE